MRSPATASALLLLALLCPSLHLGASGQQRKEWTWKDADGNVRSRADLDRILWQGESGFRENPFGTNLRGANLRGADLAGVDLAGANLLYADLRDAKLIFADLRGANLLGVDLAGANLLYADVSGVIFEPRDLPPLEWIAFARGLAQMKYIVNPGPLAQLRKQFEDAGYREEERAITYVLPMSTKLMKRASRGPALPNPFNRNAKG